MCYISIIEGGNGIWPRAVIYDLYCDRSGVSQRPHFAYEYPKYTYRSKLAKINCLYRFCCIVTWHTGFACPLVETGQTCSLPKFERTWDV